MNISKDELLSLIERNLSIKEISEKLNVSLSTIKRVLNKFKLKTTYRKNKKIENEIKVTCLECGYEFFTQRRKRIRKFCSNDCSIKSNLSILKKSRDEINKKISHSLIKNDQFGYCKWCKKEFKRRNKNHKCCSRSCSAKEIGNRPEIKKKAKIMFSALAKKRHNEEDASIGWKSRNKLCPSYPEIVTINHFNYINVEFISEFKVGKYFIDFAFLNKKIALEIDGRTHDDYDVIIKDKRKDEFLSKNGWIVYRIKWINDKNHYNRLNEFLIKYNIWPHGGM